MVSSWHANVGRLGLYGYNPLIRAKGSTFPTMAAHVQGYPANVYITDARVGANFFIWVYLPTGTSDVYSYTVPSIPPTHRHFPFGRSVDPDVHT